MYLIAASELDGHFYAKDGPGLDHEANFLQRVRGPGVAVELQLVLGHLHVRPVIMMMVVWNGVGVFSGVDGGCGWVLVVGAVLLLRGFGVPSTALADVLALSSTPSYLFYSGKLFNGRAANRTRLRS